jgi:HK97 family phage major capsid protein
MKPELIQKRRELQQQRESVNDQLTALSDTLESENRGMSEEEQGEFAKLRKQADEVDQRLELIYAQIGVDRRAGDDATPTTDIGMTAKELHQFSFLKLVRALSEPNNAEAQRAAGLELEASKAADDLARRNGELVRGARMPQSDTFVVDRREDGSTQLRSVRSLLDERAKRAVIPADVAKRVLTAGDAGQGAELVADTLRPQDFIDVLRARTVLGSLGATMLPGLVGDQQIPKKTSASAGVWLTPEDQEIPAESMPVFGQVTMTPKTIGVYTEISRQLTLQATPAIEGLVRQDQADGIAVALDNAGIYGTGLNGQPEGIANTTGINNPTDFAGAIPTSQELALMWGAVLSDNVPFGGAKGFLFNPTDAALLSTRPSVQVTEGVSGPPLFNKTGSEDGTTHGYPALISSQCVLGDVFFGLWSDLLMGFYGGLDVLVDPFSNSTRGRIRIVTFQSCDIAVRHAVSFAYNNDGV